MDRWSTREAVKSFQLFSHEAEIDVIVNHSQQFDRWGSALPIGNNKTTTPSVSADPSSAVFLPAPLSSTTGASQPKQNLLRAEFFNRLACTRQKVTFR
jgi:hypothetical protein